MYICNNPRSLSCTADNCDLSLISTLTGILSKHSASADKWTGSESRHHWCLTQWAEWHSCETLLSGLREASYWSKNGLRSNLITPKFQNFSGGACPQAPLGYSILVRTLPTWPLQIWWLRPCKWTRDVSLNNGKMCMGVSMSKRSATEVAHPTYGCLTNVLSLLYMALITFCSSSSPMKKVVFRIFFFFKQTAPQVERKRWLECRL